VAGPAAQGDAPVGLVYIGLVDLTRPGEPEPEVVELRLSGDRSTIRRQAVAAAVDMLARALGVESAT
jgi:nicotinamide mononucleotide (NMN) deamidase PncC